MLFEESGIDPAVAAERGVRTIEHGRELPKGPGEGKKSIGFSRRQRRLGPGVLFRGHRPNRSTAWCFRPDTPDPNNPGAKYEVMPKAYGGPGNVLDVHPFCCQWIGDLDVPVIFVEGIKKADSLLSALRAASERAVIVAISGVSNWLHRPDGSTSEPIPDLDDLPLKGRRVTVMFDSDVLTKWPVQRAARKLAGDYLRDVRGAHVFMTYLEHGEDGSKVGVDDYLAGGGTVAGLRRLTRPYDPKDFRLIRLGRDERLRARLEDLERTFWNFPWRGMAGHSTRDVLAVAIEEAPHSGAVVEHGLRIELSHRRWRERARVSSRTFYKCLDRLEAAGLGYRDNQGRKPGKPGAFVLRAGVNHYERERDTEQNATGTLQTLYGGGLHLRAPRLRWSAPARKARRGLVSGTRRVRQAPVRPSAALDPITRPGKIRGALVDALDALGGTATAVEVCEKLNRNPKRARDLTRRKRTAKGRDGLAVWLAEAGVLTISEGSEGAAAGATRLMLTDDWREKLDELRALGGEREADERQRASHREDQREHRDFRAKLGLEAVRRSHEKREAEMMKEAGNLDDLQRVPEPGAEIISALRRALVRWPNKLDDYPSWWASTLHVEDWLPYKPDVVAVEAALYELRGFARGAA